MRLICLVLARIVRRIAAGPTLARRGHGSPPHRRFRVSFSGGAMRTSNWILMPALLLAATTGAAASGMVPVPVPERVRGAEHVVVATVSDLQASYQQSEFGD